MSENNPTFEDYEAAVDYLWARFAETYTRGSGIPATYLPDLYPWVGDAGALTIHLVTLLKDAPYDADLRHLLDMVAVYARPLRKAGGYTMPLLYLPINHALERTHDGPRLEAYRLLDLMLSNLNMVIGRAQTIVLRSDYYRFLDSTHNVILFGHIGEYMRRREGGAPLRNVLATTAAGRVQ